MKRWIAALGLSLVCLAGCQRSAEEIKREQAETSPTVIATKKGVTLWRVRDVETREWVYFTTPTGDTHRVIPGDDDNPPKHKSVSGSIKK